MPMKQAGETQFREIDRYEDGVGWIAYPDETMQRASHAVVGDDGGVWLVDPVDAEGVDDCISAFGDVAGVVILLDRHKRDAAAFARRHEVPVYLPDWMSGVAESLDAPVERVGTDLADSGFNVHEVINNAVWQEAALYGDGTLVIPEALGTADYFSVGDRQVGVHPALRLKPPTGLREFAAERLLVGHGAGVLEDAATEIRDALSGARRRAPRLYAKAIRGMIFG